MIKRFFDLLFAVILIIPVGLFVAVLSLFVLVVNRYNPYFEQERVGRSGRRFTCYKIQSLRPLGPGQEVANKAHDAQRKTRFGAWLQDHGFDELPQLYNILIGQMSFVGPRPYLEKKRDDLLRINPDLTSEITTWWERRQTVRPGLSGWHQIHSTGPGILKLDMAYIDDPSVKRHLQITATSIWIMAVGKKRFFKLSLSVV